MSAIHPMCRVTTLCVAVPIWGVCRDSYTLVCMSVKIDMGTRLPRGMIGGVSTVWALSFLAVPHSERLSSISQHERSEFLCGRSPL